ncbi:hypothetical protein HND97_15875 [Vibrio cholerae]|nr:hypothetical protein HND97_15875 [Vibrio cholerae]
MVDTVASTAHSNEGTTNSVDLIPIAGLADGHVLLNYYLMAKWCITQEVGTGMRTLLRMPIKVSGERLLTMEKRYAK